MSEHSKIVSLGDVVIERSERVDDPSSTGISRFIGLEHFDSGRLSINRFGTTDDLESAMKVCKAGDTLLARRNVYLKRASMTELDAICSGDAIVLHETSDLVPGFLPIILNSTDFWDYANENADGSMSKRLSVKHLKGYQFHLPSKNEQLRVVNLVWKLERLDSILSSMLSDLDLCIKSRFIEMFGDPVTNPFGWSVSTIGDACYYVRDGPHKSPKYVDSGIPFISVRNIVGGEIDWSDAKYISEADYEQITKSCKPEKGDILYSKGGTTGIAKLVDTDIKFANWVHLAVLKFDDKLNGVFFEHMLNSNYCYYQSQLLTMGITNKDLVLGRMKTIRLYIPPRYLQDQFADFVKHVDKSKFMLKKHIEDTKSLQQAIINKCFEANDDV